MAYQYNYITGKYEEIPSRPLLGPVELGRSGYPTPEAGQDTIYRGLVNGVPTFTNIPERAREQGLQRWAPSVPEREVTGLGTVIGKASDEELLNAMRKYKEADISYTAENLEKAQRYKEQVASAQVFETGASARQPEAMRSKILRWASANKVPAAEVAATMKDYGVGEMTKTEPPKRYEVGGALVDESGRVIYKAEPKVAEEKLPSKIEEFEMIYPEWKGKRGTPEYAEALKKTKSDELKQGTKEYLYGQTVTQFDNDDTVKQFRRTQQVAPYIKQAKEAYAKTGNAGLLQDALIYTHNKTLDADSVVMVSEYLRSKGQGSLLDRFQGSVTRAIEGSAGLGPEQQAIMVEAIDNALKRKEQLYDQRVTAYRKRAARYGVSEDELRDTFPKSNEIFGEEGMEAAQPEATATGGGENVVRKYNPATGGIE